MKFDDHVLIKFNGFFKYSKLISLQNWKNFNLQRSFTVILAFTRDEVQLYFKFHCIFLSISQHSSSSTRQICFFLPLANLPQRFVDFSRSTISTCSSAEILIVFSVVHATNMISRIVWLMNSEIPQQFFTAFPPTLKNSSIIKGCQVRRDKKMSSENSFDVKSYLKVNRCLKRRAVEALFLRHTQKICIKQLFVRLFLYFFSARQVSTRAKHNKRVGWRSRNDLVFAVFLTVYLVPTQNHQSKVFISCFDRWCQLWIWIKLTADYFAI